MTVPVPISIANVPATGVASNLARLNANLGLSLGYVGTNAMVLAYCEMVRLIRLLSGNSTLLRACGGRVAAWGDWVTRRGRRRFGQKSAAEEAHRAGSSHAKALTMYVI